MNCHHHPNTPGLVYCPECRAAEEEAEARRSAAACSARLVYLLETADAYGNLMPSLLQTPASDEGKSAGLVEDVRTGHGPWQRLTAAGMERKFSLPNDLAQP